MFKELIIMFNSVLLLILLHQPFKDWICFGEIQYNYYQIFISCIFNTDPSVLIDQY